MGSRRGGGMGIAIVRFLGGVAVALMLAAAAFVVFSGLTEVPERTPYAAREGATVREAPATLGAAPPGSLDQPAASQPAPAPGAAGGVAVPRPSAGGAAPGTSQPSLAGTESSGLGASIGGAGSGLAPAQPPSLSPAQPPALGSGAAAGGFGAPLSAAGGALPSAPPAAAPADAAPSDAASSASVDDARNQLAALLGEAPAAPPAGAPGLPAEAPPAPVAEPAPSAAQPMPATSAEPATAAMPDPAAAESAPAPAPADLPALALAGPALDVNAEAADVPAGTPALAFVVSDAAEPGALTPEMLASLPFPVTIGIVPGDEAAAALAEAARVAGHEVLVQLPTETLGGRVPASSTLDADLSPEAATARALALIAALPQGVAVSTYPASGSAGAGTDALMALLAQHGFGYLESRAAAGGVAELGAKRAGVPFAAADRTIARRATRTQFAQQIDAAAEDAARAGPQVVLIPASAEALRALVGWSLARGGAVRAVPLSAVLRARG